jgi:glycosyltransferase involved in cell wall biosynthesis
MHKKVAILDLNPFFGGGQKFILTIQKHLSDLNTYYFLVRDQKTFDQLIGNNKIYIEEESFFSQIKTINNFISKNDIDIVIFNGNRPIYFSPFINVKKKIAYKHTSNNALQGYKKIPGHIALNLSYLFFDKIVLLYSDAKKEVLWNRKKIQIINNGVESFLSVKNHKNSQKINMLCISRLDSNKGIMWLINVFMNTFGNNDNVQLQIAGIGDLYDELNDFIKSRNSSNIKLLGFVKDINSELCNADIFILPSKFESFPLSILEAMSAGLPIIATNTGGIKEMVSDKMNGYLVNYLNDKDLKDSMLNLYQNEELRISQGNYSSKLFAERFIISKCVEKIENLIYEI